MVKQGKISFYQEQANIDSESDDDESQSIGSDGGYEGAVYDLDVNEGTSKTFDGFQVEERDLLRKKMLWRPEEFDAPPHKVAITDRNRRLHSHLDRYK